MIARSSKIIGRRRLEGRISRRLSRPAAGYLSSVLPRRHSSVQKQDIPVVRRIAANS